VQVPELLAEHVAGEPEHVAAGQRRPPRSRHVAAEQVRRPRRERRHQHGRDVVGDDRPGEQRHGHERDREPGRRRRPRELDAVRRPDHVGDERVAAVQERVRPPRERPREDLRVGAEADELAARMRQHAGAEVRERDRGVREQGRDARPAGRAHDGPSYAGQPAMPRWPQAGAT
jgi:hypothetical protein